MTRDGFRGLGNGVERSVETRSADDDTTGSPPSDRDRVGDPVTPTVPCEDRDIFVGT